MENIRGNIILKFLWLVVTLCIFNWSVDAPDAQYYCISEDAGNDDIESIVEIVLEQILDINDAIAEHDAERKTLCCYYTETITWFKCQ